MYHIDCICYRFVLHCFMSYLVTYQVHWDIYLNPQYGTSLGTPLGPGALRTLLGGFVSQKWIDHEVGPRTQQPGVVNR